MSFTPGAGTRFLLSTDSSGTISPSGPLSITGGTATANAPVLNATQTWNNAAVTFTGWQLNVTDTASNAASLLMDLQVGGVTQVSITKAGQVRVPVGSSSVPSIRVGPTEGIFSSSGSFVFQPNNNGSGSVAINQAFIALQPGMSLAWTSSGGNPLGTRDLEIHRDTANTLAQRNGVNAQTKRLYGTFTDASNYRRLAMAMTTGGVASIAPEGAGTGASGNVLHISGLPTANPGPGILWNDAGTVKVGT